MIDSTYVDTSNSIEFVIKYGPIIAAFGAVQLHFIIQWVFEQFSKHKFRESLLADFIYNRKSLHSYVILLSDNQDTFYHGRPFKASLPSLKLGLFERGRYDLSEVTKSHEEANYFHTCYAYLRACENLVDSFNDDYLEFRRTLLQGHRLDPHPARYFIENCLIAGYYINNPIRENNELHLPDIRKFDTNEELTQCELRDILGMMVSNMKFTEPAPPNSKPPESP